MTVQNGVTICGYNYDCMKNKTKILLVVTADILVFAIILLSFAWFHHVKPQKFDANHAFPLPEKRENLLHGKYEDKFTADGSIQKTENSYRSGNVSVEILSRDITVGGYPVHYYMADIYIKDISSLRSAVSEESDRRERVESLAAKHNAIVATSGDFFVFKQSGLEIRNGYVYRETINKTQDVCVIYQDGTMETILAGSVNLTAIYRKKPYHTFSFGPKLLNGGQPMEEFNTSVANWNPRCAIGYYEPGHYCLVQVDGRRTESRLEKGKINVGMTMKQTSALMEQLGCAAAYNLDGGQSSVLWYNSENLSNPYNGGRNVMDAVLILDGAVN